MSEQIDHALIAARAGLSVFPLEPLRETSAIPNWGDAATTDPERIREWWLDNPRHNVGIATGAASNLFAVELNGRDAHRWWNESGFESETATIVAPTDPERRFLLFHRSGVPVESCEPREGVRIHGEGSFIVAPGSMLPTGTFRGDLGPIALATFDPNRLDSGERVRTIPFLEVSNLLPEFTSAGRPFTDLLFGKHPARMSPSTVRDELLREALAAGLSDLQTASLVLGSFVGRDLPQTVEGLEQLLAEIARLDVGGDDSLGVGDRLILLKEAERTVVEAREWWGSRYVAWAQSVTASADDRLERLNAWLLLARGFSNAFMPAKHGPLALDLATVRVGLEMSPTSARERLNAVATAIPGGEPITSLRIPRTAPEPLEGHMWGELAEARHWSLEAVASVIWLIVDPLADGAELEDHDWSTEPVDLGQVPAKLAAELADARDRLMTEIGSPPFMIRMGGEALARHNEFKIAIDEILGNRIATLAFADNIRRCATLAALADGVGVVALDHELVAIEQAEEWLADLTIVLAKLHAFA